MKFVNSSGKWEYRDRDNEFNFMVDNQRVAGGPASSNIVSKVYSNDKNEDVVGVIYVSNLQKIAAGKEVKMKMGENVFTLDDNLLRAFKIFVSEISK